MCMDTLMFTYVTGSYPEYSPDPEEDKMRSARAGRATERSKILGYGLSR